MTGAAGPRRAVQLSLPVEPRSDVMTARPTRRPAGRLTDRRRAALGVLALCVAALAGCAARGPAAGDPAADVEAPDGGRRVARLVARLSPPVGGTASLSPASGGGLFAEIRVQGSPAANVAYPWRLFTGSCGVRGGTILGRGVDYPIIQMQANGIGEAQAHLQGEEPGGAVHVRVYASTTNATVIACGDFRS